MVTPQLDEGIQRQGESKDALRAWQSDVFSCKCKPKRFALEIFAGTARISAALSKLGITTFPIDICMYSSHDVLDKQVERKLIGWIRSGRISFIWLGMACTTFSRARKHDGLGPGPLRDPQHLWGLPGLGRKDRLKLQLGNALFQFTLRILQLVKSIIYHMHWKIQQPAWLGR